MYLTPTDKKRKPGQYRGMTRAEYQRQWYAKNKDKRILQERIRRSSLEIQTSQLFHRAKRGAVRRGLEFAISIDDVIVPEFCPIFPWIKLTAIAGQGFVDSNISLDRIDSSKGYIVGNIQVVSYKANRNKNNSTLKELIRLGEWANDVLNSK